MKRKEEETFIGAWKMRHRWRQTTERKLRKGTFAQFINQSIALCISFCLVSFLVLFFLIYAVGRNKNNIPPSSFSYNTHKVKSTSGSAVTKATNSDWQLNLFDTACKKTSLPSTRVFLFSYFLVSVKLLNINLLRTLQRRKKVLGWYTVLLIEKPA